MHCSNEPNDKNHTHGTSFTVFQWAPHTTTLCSMCDHFRQTSLGGRPKKLQPLGREPASQMLQHLQGVAGPSVAKGVDHSHLVPTYVYSEVYVVCTLCQAVVDSPVQFSCESLVCQPCIQRHILDGDQICPMCGDSLDTSHISKCTSWSWLSLYMYICMFTASLAANSPLSSRISHTMKPLVARLLSSSSSLARH